MSPACGLRALVVDDDPERLAAVAAAVRRLNPDPDDVTTLGPWQAAVLVRRWVNGQPDRLPSVAMVRARPRGWAVAALLAPLRCPQAPLVTVVLMTEGPRELVPVHITDVPGVVLALPSENPVTAAANRVLHGPASRIAELILPGATRGSTDPADDKPSRS